MHLKTFQLAHLGIYMNLSISWCPILRYDFFAKECINRQTAAGWERRPPKICIKYNKKWTPFSFSSTIHCRSLAYFDPQKVHIKGKIGLILTFIMINIFCSNAKMCRNSKYVQKLKISVQPIMARFAQAVKNLYV